MKCYPLAALALGGQMLFPVQAVLAQTEQDELIQLREQIEILSKRLEELEQRKAEVPVTEPGPAVPAASWTDAVRLTGDIRTRYERLNDEAKPSARNRNRIRARVGITAQVDENWVMGLGLASGGDNPVSTNQTLGGGGTSKGFGLDYAYFEYRGWDHFLVTGGKYRNVFFKPGGSGQNMIFDGDYRPEGIALKFEKDNLFFNAATIFMESDDRAGSQDEEMMWGIQLGYETVLSDASVIFGASYYNADLAGSRPFYNQLTYRNTLDAAGAYRFDYHEVELFAEASLTLADQPFKVYADFVRNQAVEDFDTGWVAGAAFGSVDGPGTWEFGYAFQDLEADAVYAALVDSDFADGGSDGKGHILNGAYGIGDNTEMGFSYFINEYGSATLERQMDYKRLHLYLTVSF